MPRRVGQRDTRCTVCKHAQRGRIDYLIASGSVLKPLAGKFDLKYSAIYAHAKNHVTDEYKRAIRVGPFSSESQLRALCAEGSTSVLESLRGLYGGLVSRWLTALEAGSDKTLIMLTGKMLAALELQAKLTKELMPPSQTTNVTNIAVFEHPAYLQAITALAAALRPFPEARRAVLPVLRSLQTPTDPDVPLIELQRAEAE